MSDLPEPSDEEEFIPTLITPFEQAVAKAVRGALRVEALATVLVRGAIRELVHRIACDYRLNEQQLIATYEEAILGRFARPTTSTTTNTTANDENRPPHHPIYCAGKSRKTRRACRRAVSQGGMFCAFHLDQGMEEEDRRRRRLEYRTVLQEMPPSQR